MTTTTKQLNVTNKSFTTAIKEALRLNGEQLAKADMDKESAYDNIRKNVMLAFNAKSGAVLDYTAFVTVTKHAFAGYDGLPFEEYAAITPEPRARVTMRNAVVKALKEYKVTIGAVPVSTNKEAVKKQAQKVKADEFKAKFAPQIEETALANNIEIPEAALMVAAGKPIAEAKKLTTLAYNMVDDKLKEKQEAYAKDLAGITALVKALPKQLSKATQEQIDMLNKLVEAVKAE